MEFHQFNEKYTMGISQVGESTIPLCSGVAEIPVKPVSVLSLASPGSTVS